MRVDAGTTIALDVSPSGPARPTQLRTNGSIWMMSQFGRKLATMRDYDHEEGDFDDETGYYEGQDDDPPWPDSNETTRPEQMAEEFDTAFASYTNARKRFIELTSGGRTD